MNTDPQTRIDRRGRMVIIDDSSPDCKLLQGVIASQDIDIRIFNDGSDATLQAIMGDPPDLVVTDMTMPVRNGIELCDALKMDPVTRDIPVIMITAHTDRSIRLEAIAHGAVDFLVKPFDTQEVALRIRNALKSHRLFLETAATLERLRHVELMREEMTNLIVHDLRSPISNIRNFMELWLLQNQDPPETKLRQYIEFAFAQAGVVLNQIGGMLDVSRLEANAMPLIMRLIPIGDLFDRVIAAVGGMALKRDVCIQALHEGQVCRVDADLMVRAVTNMTANAIRFAPAGSDITLACSRTANSRLRISVKDRGPGIPDNLRARLFSKFGAAEVKEHKSDSAGYGLYMCTLVASAHHGAVGYDAAEGGGSIFWMEIPETELKDKPAAPLPCAESDQPVSPVDRIGS